MIKNIQAHSEERNIETKKDIHKCTWRLPNNKTTVQNDYVLVQKHKEKCFTKIRTHKGPDADSDYFMLRVKMSQIISVYINQQKILKIACQEELNKILEDKNIDDMWEQIKSGMGKILKINNQCRNNRYKEWFDDESRKELEERNRFRMLERGRPEAREKCKENEPKALSQVKKLDESYIEITRLANSYKIIKTKEIDTKGNPTYYKEKNEDEKVPNQRREYFDQLLNSK